MDIESIGKELAKHVKTQKDFSDITGQLMKVVLETALNAELDDHLGYEKHEKSESPKVNTRNGYTRKTVKGEKGHIELDVPRDRQASFEPKVIPKGKTRLEGFEDNILALYARGMTTRPRGHQRAVQRRGDLSHGHFECHRCRHRRGDCVAKSAAGKLLSHRLFGLYRGQGAPG